MKKQFKRLCSIVFALLLSISTLVGCSKPLSETDLVLPTYEDNNSLDIQSALPPNPTNRKMIEDYKAAGFTRLCITDDYMTIDQNNPAFLDALDLCEELGLEVMILPHRTIVKYGLEAGIEDGANWYEKRFGNMDFTQTPVTAFYITDEPRWAQYEDLENRYLPWFNENYGNGDIEFFVNLFGRNQPNTIWEKDNTYDEYAERYLEILDQVQSDKKTFSVDHYVLFNDGTQDYMSDYNVMTYIDAATRAEARGLNFGACIQSFGGGGAYRYPETYAELSFSVYDALVYGADTLFYFGYCDWPSFNFTCMVTEGEPNELWYHTKKVNEYIQKFDHVFMSFKWEKLLANVGTGSRSPINESFEIARAQNMLATSLTGITSVTSKYDIIVSENTDGTNDGFWIMNYDDPGFARANKTTLTFENADGVLYYRNGEPNTVVLGKDKTFTLDLEAGEGVFAIPVYAKK